MGLKNEFEKKDRKKDDPGPGQYEPKKSSHKISYSICTRGEEGKGHSNPGPAQYKNILRDKFHESIPGSKIGKD